MNVFDSSLCTNYDLPITITNCLSELTSGVSPVIIMNVVDSNY